MSTRRRVLSWGLTALCLALIGPGRALAQGPTIGDAAAASPGSETSSLGRSPGSGASQLRNPGSGDSVLGGQPGASTSRAPTSISTPSGGVNPAPSMSITPPSDLQPATIPVFGTLAIPKITDDEGPADGLSLDAAIERLVRENLELRGKSMEIPQAAADILTASLRANPIFYADAQLVPYGAYSSRRPGGQTQYDVNISYPLDITRKRQARTVVAARAKHVLEAQYQDAVRLQIDNLYTAFVDVLAARGTVRFSEAGVKGLKEVKFTTQALFDKGERTKADVLRVNIQLQNAEVGLVNNQEALRRAKRTLGTLLNIPSQESEAMEIRGSIRDSFPPPPPTDELVKIALSSRPDLHSFRLGVSRAEADVRLARANALGDVYLLLQPYTLQDNTPQGLKSPTSYAIGVTVPVPLYNRNQGNILRSKLNVTQTQIELVTLERAIMTEVRQAEQAYAVTLSAVKKLEESVLPEAEIVLADSKLLFAGGEFTVIDYINARRDYNDTARQYLDSLVQHRRSMLNLNSTLGRRIMP